MRKAFDFAFWSVVVVLAIALPPLYDDSYVMAELILFGIYFAINLMWSLVLGTAGLYSFATLAFVGAGGVFVRLAVDQPRPAVVGVRARRASPSARSAGCSSRCRRCACAGVYFALLTIGLVEACNQYVTSDTENLGGAQGLVGADSIIPPSKQGLIEGYYYAYIAIAVIVGVALLVYWWVVVGPPRAAPAHGARVGAGRAGVRHRHPARAPRRVRDHGGRARARRRVPRRRTTPAPTRACSTSRRCCCCSR